MYDSETFDNLKTYGFASTINAELGSLNLKSITSYRYLKTDALNDTDGTVAPLLATFGGSKSKSYSQEFQISGDVTDRLSFITGAYWSRETRSEEHTSELQSLMRISYAVFCLKKKHKQIDKIRH